MKFRILRGFIHNAVECAAGDIVEFAAHEAARYMEYGKIVPHDESEIVTNAVDDLENADPVISNRGRKPKNVA